MERAPRTDSLDYQTFRLTMARPGVAGYRGVRNAVLTWVAALLLLAGIPLQGQSRGSSLSSDLTKLLREIKAADTDLLAVSEEDGRFLRVMAASNGTKRALEIGGANGYSAIWIALALRETGGRLTTIEFDPQRARQAQENIRRAGLAEIVTVVPGDAFKEIPKLAGEFDFVFLDAWKRDYRRFFDTVLPRLRPGGLFLAHNVVNKESEMRDFLTAIRSEPSLFTAIVSPSGEGMSVSYKLQSTVHK
jgi:predicted O-methyltransferase YrrM